MFIYILTYTKTEPMVSSDQKLANIVGGKSARACDNCVRKRARWYCAADDAFLCQSCDSSVHSANPLARRHERVRLKSDVSAIKTFNDQSRVKLKISAPSWHKGFARKARTPRKNKHAKHGGPFSTRIRLVPEISGEEQSQEENEEQLLYRVPIFDPFVAELCTSVNSSEAANNIQNDGETRPGLGPEFKPGYDEFGEEMGHVQGFLPSEMDLAEFAADVESLLGNGLEGESFDIEGLGILDDERERGCSERVKVEDEEIGEVVNLQMDGDQFIGFGRETFELNFDYDSPNNGEEDCKEETVEPMVMMSNFEDSNKVYGGKKIFLRLDHEAVMSAWDNHKSPWTNGERPELNPDDCWPDCLVRICLFDNFSFEYHIN